MSCSGTLRDQTTCLRISRKRPISVFNPLDYFSHQKARDAICKRSLQFAPQGILQHTYQQPATRQAHLQEPHLEPRGCINSANRLYSGSWSVLHKKAQDTTVNISSSLLTKTDYFSSHPDSSQPPDAASSFLF